MKRNIAVVTAFLLWALWALLLSPPASAAPAPVNTTCSTQPSHIDWTNKIGAVRYADGSPNAAPSFCLRDTSKSAHRLELQGDNNFVMYAGANSGGCVIWASNTQGNYSAQLSFQKDGNVVIYDRYTHAVKWSSHTYGSHGTNFRATVIGFTSYNPPYGLYEDWTVLQTSGSTETLASFGGEGPCR